MAASEFSADGELTSNANRWRRSITLPSSSVMEFRSIATRIVNGIEFNKNTLFGKWNCLVDERFEL